MTERAEKAAFQWPYTLSPYDSGMVIEDVWPTLFFGAERLAEVRRKAEKLTWAADAVAQMQREAESVLREPPLLPEERIGWRHDFYSHRTAEHLLYDPTSPRRFLDPLEQTWHDSEAQHQAWVLLTHERTLRMMRSLGILYGLTGDERHAAWVAEGLRVAARFIPRTDLREGHRNGALYFHPLYDSQVLLLLANAYSLTRESRAYSEADHRAVREGAFEAGMPSQIRFFEETGAHNMTCYVGASLAVAGEVMGRGDWRRMGLAHPTGGLPALLREGLRTDRKGRADGFWFEGTTFYHFYSICPMVAVYELMRADGGLTPEVRERFEKLFEAPVRMCDPDLRLPCLGDLGAPGARSLAIYRHVYEYAAGQLNPDLFGPALRAIYDTGAPRNSLSALAYGPDEVSAKRLSQRSTVLPVSGIGVFRGKTPEGPFYLLFRSGQHGAGHDHADRLTVDLRALGEVIAPDLGTAGYAVKDAHAYYRSTLAHNTLMVDEQDQGKASRARLNFRAKGAVGVVEDAYEGVRLERRVGFAPPVVQIEDRCTSQEAHRYGWVFHARGGMALRPVKPCGALDLPPLPETGAFAWFRDRQTVCVAGEICVDWRVSEGVWLRLLVTSDGPFEATTGRTPGNPTPDGHGTVFLRAAGRERVFRAALEVHRGTPSLWTLDMDQPSGK
ncbi:MAG: hypothetical protein EXS64_08455 [Candidatus Latescibacteria bacterium]|nr:hypothetical protein [Candidatus Latescibacterota bacterium]